MSLDYTQMQVLFFFNVLAITGILVPHPGIKPMALALEMQSLNHWTIGKVPDFYFLHQSVVTFPLLSSA